MLMALGPVAFDLVTNLDNARFNTKSAYARHDVVQAAPIWEAMGDDEACFDLSGVIHPEALGVTGALAALERARANEVPLPLIRGDGTPLGFVIIMELEHDHKYLNDQGIGKEIHFSVTLMKANDVGLTQAPDILRLFQSALA